MSQGKCCFLKKGDRTCLSADDNDQETGETGSWRRREETPGTMNVQHTSGGVGLSRHRNNSYE